MEDLFDFQIDYESLITTPAIHQIAEPEEDDLYEEVIQGSKKSFRCTFSGCGKIFKFKSEITRHVIIHQNDRPYVCNHTGCNKSFKRADALENHVRIHEGVLPHKCEFPNCDRKFATKAALRYHQIRHSNNKAFKCDIEGCNKTFLTSSQLKQHQKAFNSHQKCPLLKIEEPEPVKMVHCNPDLQSWELADQVTKCGESIQWEMKTQENGEMEKFEHLVKYIINENRILKQKLQECEKQKDYPEKNACNASFNSQPLCFESNESSSYFDSYELKFLEFLKGHEDSSF